MSGETLPLVVRLKIADYALAVTDYVVGNFTNRATVDDDREAMRKSRVALEDMIAAEIAQARNPAPSLPLYSGCAIRNGTNEEISADGETAEEVRRKLNRGAYGARSGTINVWKNNFESIGDVARRVVAKVEGSPVVEEPARAGHLTPRPRKDAAEATHGAAEAGGGVQPSPDPAAAPCGEPQINAERKAR